MPIIDIQNSKLADEDKEYLIKEITANPSKELEILENFRNKLENNLTDLYSQIGI